MVAAAALPGDLGRARPAARVRPWQEHDAILDFFVECDSGEPIRRHTAALAGYEELAQANPKLATVTLLWMISSERETEVRHELHPQGCLVATATPLGGRNPAETVWLPLGSTGPRRRLADLADPNCWPPDRR